MISEELKNRLQELSGILTEIDRIGFLKQSFIDSMMKSFNDDAVSKEKLSPVEKKSFFEKANSDFEIIVNSDPTSNKKFTQWLLKLYSKKFLKLEDLYKAIEYLTLFEKVKHKLPLEDRDINKYKNLPDLYNKISPFKEVEIISNTEKDKMAKSEGADKILDNNKWLIIIPKTEEAACLYGKETQWCTASKKDNRFDNYNRRGKLFIIVNKSIQDSPTQNPLKKLQFHFEDNMFMNANDDSINVGDFFRSNPELIPVFRKSTKIFNKEFELEHRLLPKEESIKILDDPQIRLNLTKKYGVNWVFNYYNELGEQEKLKRLFNNEEYIFNIFKNGTWRIDSLNDSIEKKYDLSDLAKSFYKNKLINKFLESGDSTEADLERFIIILFNLGNFGEQISKKLMLSDHLYNLFKSKEALVKYYSLFNYKSGRKQIDMGKETISIALNRLKEKNSKYKKDIGSDYKHILALFNFILSLRENYETYLKNIINM